MASYASPTKPTASPPKAAALHRRPTPRAEVDLEPIQARLEVGPAIDGYEREADAVADRVMQMTEATASTAQPIPLARMPEARGPRPTSPPPMASAKAPSPSDTAKAEPEGDSPEHEAEADPRGETMMRGLAAAEGDDPSERPPASPSTSPNAVLQRACAACEEEVEQTLQRAPDPSSEPEGVLQRACAACEEEAEQTLQRAPDSSPRPALDASFTTRLSTLRQRRGKPLPHDTRRFMELRFGHDFEDVRTHANDEAATLARSIRAKAFTLQGDIVFGRGHYQPHTTAGRHLLAHELAHTIQQGVSTTLNRQPLPGLSRRGTGTTIQRRFEDSELIQWLQDREGGTDGPRRAQAVVEMKRRGSIILDPSETQYVFGQLLAGPMSVDAQDAVLALLADLNEVEVEYAMQGHDRDALIERFEEEYRPLIEARLRSTLSSAGSVEGHRVEQLDFGVARLTTTLTRDSERETLAVIGDVSVERSVSMWELFVSAVARWGPDGPLRVGRHRATELARKLQSKDDVHWQPKATISPGNRVPLLVGYSAARALWKEVAGFDSSDRRPSDAEKLILAHPKLFVAFQNMQVANERGQTSRGGIFNTAEKSAALLGEMNTESRFLQLLRDTDEFTSADQVEAVRDEYVREFTKRARSVAHKLLEDSRDVAMAEKRRYKVGSDDIKTLMRVFELLKPPPPQFGPSTRTLTGAGYFSPVVRMNTGMMGSLRDPSQGTVEQTKQAQHEAAVAALPQEFPVLWALRKQITSRLMIMNERRLSWELIQELEGRLENIADTKEELDDDPDFVWQLPMALETTAQVSGMDDEDPRRLIIRGERERLHHEEKQRDAVIGMMIFAAGILAAVLPPAGLAMIAAELAVAGVDIAFTLGQWNAAVARHRASETSLSADTQLTTFDPGEYTWLAIGLLGAGIGVGAAMGPAFRALRGTIEVAETTEEVARAARRVGQEHGLSGRKLDGFVDELVDAAAHRRSLRSTGKGAVGDDIIETLSKDTDRLAPAQLEAEAAALRAQKGYPNIGQFPAGGQTPHKWRRGKEWGTWCRWSEPQCFTFIEDDVTKRVRLEPSHAGSSAPEGTAATAMETGLEPPVGKTAPFVHDPGVTRPFGTGSVAMETRWVQLYPDGTILEMQVPSSKALGNRLRVRGLDDKMTWGRIVTAGKDAPTIRAMQRLRKPEKLYRGQVERELKRLADRRRTLQELEASKELSAVQRRERDDIRRELSTRGAADENPHFKAAKDEKHLVVPKGTEVTPEVMARLSAAQELMNDLNKGSKGDGSTAYVVLAEQVAGGVMPKQVVEGTLHLQKAEDAAIRLRRLAADEHFPQEARDRMLREAIKHEEAVDWAESYSTRMAHGEPPSLDDLPRWATEYRDTLEDLR